MDEELRSGADLLILESAGDRDTISASAVHPLPARIVSLDEEEDDPWSGDVEEDDEEDLEDDDDLDDDDLDDEDWEDDDDDDDWEDDLDDEDDEL